MHTRRRLILLTALLLLTPPLFADDAKTTTFKETFDASFDAARFTTRIPNKNTTVRDGVLWTRGSSGRKYPPMIYLHFASIM